MTGSAPLMELRNLEKHFDQTTSVLEAIRDAVTNRERPRVRAVDGINLTVEENQVLGVIGESGCGKSTLLMTLIGLYSPTGGDLYYRGKPTASFTKTDWKSFRQNVQIIFQDPFTSLDPKLTVRETVTEPLAIHGMDQRDERVRRALSQAELNPPEKYLDRLPNQLSGGERQRVSIARALVVEPDVILADEPVSMLDVSTQASILNLLSGLTEDLDMSMIYISHDLSTVSYICERVNVMYLGRFVESAPTEQLLTEPKHPYTRALIDAIPIPDPHHERDRSSVQGRPSDPINLPGGCRFKDRCPERMDICDADPAYLPVEEGADHHVACHLHYDHEEWLDDGGEPGPRGSVEVHES